MKLTIDDVNSLLADLRDSQIRLERLFAERAAAHAEVDDLYASRITSEGESHEEILERLQMWAEKNPEHFPGNTSHGGVRHLRLINGEIGFRKGNWRVEKLPKWTWERTQKTKAKAKVILESLQASEALSHYIVSKPEIDKAGILRDRDRLHPSLLATVGIAVVQDDNFYAEPNIKA